MSDVPDPPPHHGESGQSRQESLARTVPAQLHEALDAFLANRRSHAAAQAFRGALCAYVTELRDAGLPPERVLVAVKTLLYGTPTPVVEEAVVWCVGAYFDAP